MYDAYVLICDRRKRAEIPIYSFAQHSRLDKTMSIYSPHVLVVEGIFALHDPRVLKLLDMKVRVMSRIARCCIIH